MNLVHMGRCDKGGNNPEDGDGRLTHRFLFSKLNYVKTQSSYQSDLGALGPHTCLTVKDYIPAPPIEGIHFD